MLVVSAPLLHIIIVVDLILVPARKLLRHGGQQPTVSVFQLTKPVAEDIELFFLGVTELLALLQEIDVRAGTWDAYSAKAIVGGGGEP